MARTTTAPTSRRERRAAQRLQQPQRRRARQARSARPAWKSPLVVATAAALVLGVVAIAVALPRGDDDQQELRMPPATYPADLIAGDVIGPAGAPVVIELYSDFQCPACRLFVTEQLHRLVDEFVTSGTLRIEARDIAFLGRGQRDESLELAVGARCAAEQDRYWQFHDLVFWNQGRENRGDHSEDFIERIATQAGLDVTAFDGCLDRADVRRAITDQTSNALRAGIGSTPTLLVNGQAVVGVPDYDQLAGLIRALAAAASPTPAP